MVTKEAICKSTAIPATKNNYINYKGAMTNAA